MKAVLRQIAFIIAISILLVASSCASQPPSPSESDQTISTTSPGYSEPSPDKDLYTVKHMGDYIYCLQNDVFNIYSAKEDDTKIVDFYSIPERSGYPTLSLYNIGFYLSSDGNTVTMIVPYKNGKEQYVTSLISLDVSDPTDIKEITLLPLESIFYASKDIGENIVLVSGGASKPQTYEEAKTGNSLLIQILDRKTFEQRDSLTVQSSTAYFKGEHLYTADTYQENTRDGEVAVYTVKTDISCFSYSNNTISQINSVTVSGCSNIPSRFYEYNGILRIVSDTYTARHIVTDMGDGSVKYTPDPNNPGGHGISVYLISLDTFEIISSIEELAHNEEPRTTVFDGDNIYLNTSEGYYSYYLYAINTSDINNLTFSKTEKIDRSPYALLNLGSGYVAVTSMMYSPDNANIAIYKADKDGLSSVCTFELDDVHIVPSDHSYFVDQENRLIGFGAAYGKSHEPAYYFILEFNGEEVRIVKKILVEGNIDLIRAVYSDGYAYVFSLDGYSVSKIE